jgi:uncharacterized protein (TIGR03437 family)
MYALGMNSIPSSSPSVVARCCLLLAVGLGTCAAQSGPPVIAEGGVVNAAKYTLELAPGAMASAFGTNLAAGFEASTSRILPTSIAGVSVEVTGANAKPSLAPVYFVSPGQINFQMPFGLPIGSAQVRVITPKGASAPMSVTVLPAAPAFFTVDASGAGEALFLHATDYAVVTGARPASAGEYLVLMATGLGEVNPPAGAGRPGGDNADWGPLNWHVVKPTVLIGDREVPVLFWGLMPGFSGVSQINVQVPADMAPGLHSIQIVVNGATTQGAIAISVGRDVPVLASVPVTPAGANVTAPQGVTVAIPSGVFQSPTVVSITGGSEQPGGTGRISEVYGVRGLPAQLSQPVTITIPLRQPPAAGTETLVAMNTGAGVQGSGIQYLEATAVGANSVQVTLPALADANPGANTAASAAADTSGPEISFWVMTFYRRVNTAKGHFMIFYPSNDAALESKVPTIGQYLEDAYDKIAALGLNWGLRKRWPMRVVIGPFEGDKADSWGFAEPSTLGKDYWSISLNSNKLSGAGISDAFRATVAHELLHVMQDLYDPRSAYRIAKFQSPWLWYWEAASTWLESVVLSDTSYIPGVVSDDNFSFPTTHGLEYPSGSKALVQGHGYGASMFLHYLMKTHPQTTLGDTIKEVSYRAPGIIAQSIYAPVQVMNSLYGTLGVKWVDFIESWAEGKTYGKVFPSIEQILGLRKDYYDFKQDTDTGTTFTWNSPNLSARIILVRFHQTWPADTKLSLSFEAGGDLVTAILYRVSPNGWTKAGRFTDSFTFDNAEAFQKNGEQLMIVIADGSGVGAYNASAEAKLRIQKGGDLLAFLKKKTKINHKLYGTITCSSGGGGSMIGTFFSKGPIQWKGTSFTVAAPDSDLVSEGEPPHDVTVTGTLSKDGATLQSLSYRRYRKYDRTFKDSGGTEFYSYDERTTVWTVSNLPLTDTVERVIQGKAMPRYQAKGEAGAQAVSGFSYVHKYWFGSPKDFKPDKLKETTCTIAVSGDGAVLDF